MSAFAPTFFEKTMYRTRTNKGRGFYSKITLFNPTQWCVLQIFVYLYYTLLQKNSMKSTYFGTFSDAVTIQEHLLLARVWYMYKFCTY